MNSNLAPLTKKCNKKIEKFCRVSRFFHSLNLKVLKDKIQQAKDSYAKRVLAAYGLCQLSDHIEEKYDPLTQEKPARNFLLIDRKKFLDETEGLTACEKLLLISLASSSCREGEGLKKILMATHEIKNLLSGALSKSFIKVAMRCFVDFGLIGVIRKGRYRWKGHTYQKGLICLNISFLELRKTVATLFSSYTENQDFLMSEYEKNLNTSINGPPAPTEASKDCFVIESDSHLEEYRAELHEIESVDYQANANRVIDLRKNEVLRKRFIAGGIAKNWESLQAMGFSEIDKYWNKNILGKFLDELVIRSEDIIRNPVRFFISSYHEHKKHGQDKYKRHNWAFDNFIKSVNAMTSTARYAKTIHIDRIQAEQYFEDKKEDKKQIETVETKKIFGGLKLSSDLFKMFS